MSTPKAKRGCRPLALGEQVQAGDLVWFASRWQPVEEFSAEIGKVIEQYSYRHCRPISGPISPGAESTPAKTRRLKPSPKRSDGPKSGRATRSVPRATRQPPKTGRAINPGRIAPVR